MRIFIVECLNPMDLLQGRSESAALESMCRLLGHEVATFHVQSSRRLRETCDFIAGIDESHDAKKKTRVPLCVHVAAHGNAKGLGLGPATATWEDVADAILPLAKLSWYSGPLILVVSACDAGHQSLTSELANRREDNADIRPPAYVFVTCDARLDWADSVAAWTVFYHLMPKARLDEPETVREVLAKVRAAGGAVLRYHRWDSEQEAYKRYEPKPLMDVQD